MPLQDFVQRTRPGGPHQHRRFRAAASLAAALAAGGIALGVAFLGVTTTAPWDAPTASVIILVLLAIWASGLWWRWDSPDRRGVNDERERRGY